MRGRAGVCARDRRIPCFFFEFEFPGAGRPMMSGSTTPACAVRDGRRAVVRGRFGAVVPFSPGIVRSREATPQRAQRRRSRILRGPSRTMATAASLHVAPAAVASARRRAAAPGPVGGRVPSRVLARAGKADTDASSARVRPRRPPHPRARSRDPPRGTPRLAPFATEPRPAFAPPSRPRASRARAPRDPRVGIFYRIRPKKYPFQFKSPSSPLSLIHI